MTGLRRLLGLAALALGLALGAATDVEALTVCSATMTPLAFGDVDVSVRKGATAQVTVTCNSLNLGVLGNVKVRMCVSIGKGGTDPRTMPDTTGTPPGSNTFAFQIYKSASYTDIWGSRAGAAPGNVPLQVDFDYDVTLLAASTTRIYNVYGRTAVQLTAAAGSYSDSYGGSNAEITYQYNEPLLFLPSSLPGACTSGGQGGGTGVPFDFTVSARVPPSCTLSAVSDLNFGSHPGPITVAHNNSTVLNMLCRRGTAWTLSLNNGLHADGGIRRMQLGATDAFVRYGLYRDESRLQPWGQSAGVDTLGGTGSGLADPRTVFGRVPAGQNVPAGSYSDKVTATITY